MKPVPIPVLAAVAEDEAPEFMAMPREMERFAMPAVPEPGPGMDVAGARAVLARFAEHFGRWLEQGGAPPAIELRGLAPEALRVLNESLGEGEVSAIVEGGIRIQESVFSGIWREQHWSEGGALLHDWLIGAAMPPVVGTAANANGAPRLRELPLPAGAMNVPALVHELQQAMDRCAPGTPAHVINLTLLPLSPADAAHLDALLEGGSVVILSRGFGSCRISATAARGVWRVQYFNNMQTLILNTIEVTAIPEVAIAAREDLEDSLERLGQLVQWMDEAGAT